ncbi:MAG: hypothetical protein GOV02_00115 [Candidatus Aenigmarchaeota archaeon]|nr:hypothetical protein [Candidatus Aenigmarchaeota archaeon]
MDTKLIKLDFPEGYNIILGMSHFIKTVEDIYETLVARVPDIKFGLAFCEASGPRLIRRTGTDNELVNIAVENAKKIAAGHSFIIVLKDTFPITVLNDLKMVEEICTIYCATANPVEVIIAESEQGRGIMGVIDGSSSLGVENEQNVAERKEFLRRIGYKS